MVVREKAKPGTKKQEGQPFRLDLLAAMAKMARDKDVDLPRILVEAECAPLGVEEILDAREGVMA